MAKRLILEVQTLITIGWQGGREGGRERKNTLLLFTYYQIEGS